MNAMFSMFIDRSFNKYYPTNPPFQKHQYTTNTDTHIHTLFLPSIILMLMLLLKYKRCVLMFVQCRSIGREHALNI